VGGHCIPVDPFYLAWKAREYDFSTRFIELAGEINLRMPYFVVGKAERILGAGGKPLRGSRVLILGVTYKKDLPDLRESPATKVLQLLLEEGCEVQYYDPYVSSVEAKAQNQGAGGTRHRFHLDGIGELTESALNGVDLVIILTDHSCVDYATVVKHSRSVLDTRNALGDLNLIMGNVWSL